MPIDFSASRQWQNAADSKVVFADDMTISVASRNGVQCVVVAMQINPPPGVERTEPVFVLFGIPPDDVGVTATALIECADLIASDALHPPED